MARDANLILVDAVTVVANGNSVAIDTEGGFLAWVALQLGAMTDAKTYDIRVQVSPDGGSTYYMQAKFQQLVGVEDGKFLRVPVYIPRPETAGTIVTYPTKVRLNYIVSGGSESMVITYCYLEPMVSLAVPANDDLLENGAAIQLSVL